jgi:hypothetical protein
MKHFIPIFSIVLMTAFLLAPPARISAGDKYQELVNCDLHAGPCTQTLASGVAVMLEVLPKPIKAMQDLSFKVTLTGNLPASPKTPYIDLGMPGMQMGPNRVQLKSVGNNSYEGRGVIVKCPSGRRIWRASVILPEVGRTDFIFDVIY